MTGFPFPDLRGRPADPPESPSALQRFLDAGPAPIVFTLGSSAVWVAKDFFEQGIAAAKALGRRALLLVGDGRSPGSLPESVASFDYASYWAAPAACPAGRASPMTAFLLRAPRFLLWYACAYQVLRTVALIAPSRAFPT